MDCGTPVTVIYGFARALRERLGGELPEELRENLECMESSAERIKGVLDKFLIVSLLRRERVTPCTVPYGAAEILEEACSSLKEEERKRLVVQGDPGSYRLVTDRYHLSLILANLLVNAFRFSDDSSRVILRVGESEGGVLLEVVDFGDGFEMDEVKWLFSPFAQLGGTGCREGVGLGLYIVRLRADLLGLKVEVDTRPGEGSRFAILIPGGRLDRAPEEKKGIPTRMRGAREAGGAGSA